MAPTRLDTEEVTKKVPLPAWAHSGDRAAAGRVVRTPPATPRCEGTSHVTPRVVPPWALSSEETSNDQSKEPGHISPHCPQPRWLTAVVDTADAADRLLQTTSATATSTKKRTSSRLQAGKPKAASSHGSQCKSQPRAEKSAQVSGAAVLVAVPGEAPPTQSVQAVRTSASDAADSARDAVARAKDGLLVSKADEHSKLFTTAAQKEKSRLTQAGSTVPGLVKRGDQQKNVADAARLKKTTAKEIQAAIEAQITFRTRRKQHLQHEDRCYAAEIQDRTACWEQAEAEASATRKERERTWYQDIAAQRDEKKIRDASERRAHRSAVGPDGSKWKAGLEVGDDPITTLNAKLQARSAAAAVHAEGLAELRRQREQAAEEERQKQAEDNHWLQHQLTLLADRDAQRTTLLAQQSAITMQGRLAERGFGIPTGRHAPRHRPTSAEHEANAKKYQRNKAKAELAKLHMQAADRQAWVQSFLSDAEAQIAHKGTVRRAEVAEGLADRATADTEAVAFAEEERAIAALERQQRVAHAKQIRIQAEDDKTRRQEAWAAKKAEPDYYY